MAQIGFVAVSEAVRRLQGQGGLEFALARITERENGSELIPTPRVDARNVSAKLAEAGGAAFPTVSVWCERIENRMKEKGRRFSGTVSLRFEVRVTADRSDGVSQQLASYVDAVTAVLDLNRGDWGSGLFFSGEYTVKLKPIAHGGRNFLQEATVEVDVAASLD